MHDLQEKVALIEEGILLKVKNEKYRQALNRVLPLINDCPYNHGLTNGIDDCAADDIYEDCNKCWKIALGVEE